MAMLIVAIVFAIVGFFAANVMVGKKAEKKVRHVKAVRPVLSIEDKVMMRAGYASYVITTVHLQDGDHHYLSSYVGNHFVPAYEVMVEGDEFDLVRIHDEEHVHV